MQTDLGSITFSGSRNAASDVENPRYRENSKATARGRFCPHPHVTELRESQQARASRSNGELSPHYGPPGFRKADH